jgi:hypothetical protein
LAILFNHISGKILQIVFLNSGATGTLLRILINLQFQQIAYIGFINNQGIKKVSIIVRAYSVVWGKNNTNRPDQKRYMNKPEKVRTPLKPKSHVTFL